MLTLEEIQAKFVRGEVEFSAHAGERMTKRDILATEIAEAMRQPECVEISTLMTNTDQVCLFLVSPLLTVHCTFWFQRWMSHLLKLSRYINLNQQNGKMFENERTKSIMETIIQQKQCNICGGQEHHKRSITHLFEAPQGETAVISHIPAVVCERCGEITFSFETMQRIGEVVRAVAQKNITASAMMPLYDFAKTEELAHT